MLYELPNGVISVHDGEWECMQTPVQGAVKDFIALKGGGPEPFLFLKVKVHANPIPNPHPQDAIQVLMAAQRQLQEVQRCPKVKHEDGGSRGKTTLHNKVATYCLREGFTYNRTHNGKDGDRLFDELIDGLWLLNTVKQNNLMGTPELVKDHNWLRVASVQQEISHHAPKDSIRIKGERPRSSLTIWRARNCSRATATR